MAGYKFEDFRRDHEMLFRWDRHRLAHLSKDEKALYAARYWCFAVTPEGLGRRRIKHLTNDEETALRPQQVEFDNLRSSLSACAMGRQHLRREECLGVGRGQAESRKAPCLIAGEAKSARSAQKG